MRRFDWLIPEGGEHPSLAEGDVEGNTKRL